MTKDSLPSVEETPEDISAIKHSLSSDCLPSDGDDVVVEVLQLADSRRGELDTALCRDFCVLMT